jgi:hypothetical protein
MSLVPAENAPTADDAENALGALRDSVIIPLQTQSRSRDWHLALDGLADGVEDVIVTVRRLASHERVWRESMGTKPVEPPISANPNHNTMQQMVRGRADLRSFILLADVLLDDATKSLRSLGALSKATGSFFALAKHIENGGADWSRPLLPLASDLIGLQYSLGYFRDKFVVHRGLIPVTAIYLPDGKVRLSLAAGTKTDADRERGGREVASVVPVPDMPLDSVYDVRLDIAFAALRRAEPAKRAQIGKLLEEFGAISPDPYETAVEIAETLGGLLVTAAREVGPPTSA